MPKIPCYEPRFPERITAFLGERFVHTEGVHSSILCTPTIFSIT